MSAVFARSFAWRGPVRALLFVGVALAAGLGLARVVPFSNGALLLEVAREMQGGAFAHVSDRTFALALASLVVQVAGALAVTYFLLHVVVIRLALRAARRELRRLDDTQAFAARFDAVRDALERNVLIGHAFAKFAETLVLEPKAVRNIRIHPG